MENANNTLLTYTLPAGGQGEGERGRWVDDEMTDIYPVVLVVAVVGTWLAFTIQQGRLLLMFRRTFPEVARQKIPYAFDYMRHPEKVLFFFRRSSTPVLRQDPTIWRLCRQVRTLAIMAIVVPVIGMAIGVTFAAIQISRETQQPPNNTSEGIRQPADGLPKPSM